MRDNRPSLNELEALRAMIAEGTTAAAGRRLGRAQSSISRSLAELERRVGHPLFARRGRLIEPTTEALALNRELDSVFDTLDRLSGRASASNDAKLLSIAATPPFAAGLLPKVFAAFSADHPGCRLLLEVGGTEQVVRLVAEGVSMLGVTDSQVSNGNVRLAPFRRSRVICLMPEGHRLASREQVDLSDLQGETMVALARRHSMRAQIDAMLKRHGITHEISAEASTAIVALRLIREGVGIGLMNPFPMLSYDAEPGIIARPLKADLAYQNAFMFAEHAPPTALAKRFQRFLIKFVSSDPWSEPIR